MAFYNEETRFPNLFLSETLHNAECFCPPCRQRNVAAINDKREASLRQRLVDDLAQERQARSSALFEVTKQQILYGKLYKDICMANTRLKYFKCWAKKQPVYQRFVNGDKERKQEFNKHCQLVNESAYCFDNWELIVSNLTDRRMTSIDARSFSVAYFASAGSIDWCLEYNEKVRKSGSSKERLYSRDQVDAIFQQIVASGILDDIEHNEQVAASIGNQLQRKMVAYCRRNRR